MNMNEREWVETITVAGTHAAKYHTFEMFEEILLDGIPGDFVECGTMAGGHPAIASYLIRKHCKIDRKIHLFDSFEGVPGAGPMDHPDTHKTFGTYKGGRITSTGISKCTVQGVKDFFAQWGVIADYCEFHPGWFEEVMEREAAKIERIAFLRVDTDIYSSTRECYRHLYSKVVPGGIIVDDDWGPAADGPTACRRAVIEELGFTPTVTDVPGNLGTVWWRKY